MSDTKAQRLNVDSATIFGAMEEYIKKTGISVEQLMSGIIPPSLNINNRGPEELHIDFENVGSTHGMFPEGFDEIEQRQNIAALLGLVIGVALERAGKVEEVVDGLAQLLISGPKPRGNDG